MLTAEAVKNNHNKSKAHMPNQDRNGRNFFEEPPCFMYPENDLKKLIAQLKSPSSNN